MEKEKIKVSFILHACAHHSKTLLQGRTVTLKLKTVDFEVKSRGVTLLEPVSRYEQLYQIVSGLLQHEITACTPLPLRLRLMGKYSICRTLLLIIIVH